MTWTKGSTDCIKEIQFLFSWIGHHSNSTCTTTYWCWKQLVNKKIVYLLSKTKSFQLNQINYPCSHTKFESASCHLLAEAKDKKSTCYFKFISGCILIDKGRKVVCIVTGLLHVLEDMMWIGWLTRKIKRHRLSYRETHSFHMSSFQKELWNDKMFVKSKDLISIDRSCSH